MFSKCERRVSSSAQIVQQSGVSFLSKMGGMLSGSFIVDFGSFHSSGPTYWPASKTRFWLDDKRPSRSGSDRATVPFRLQFFAFLG